MQTIGFPVLLILEILNGCVICAKHLFVLYFQLAKKSKNKLTREQSCPASALDMPWCSLGSGFCPICPLVSSIIWVYHHLPLVAQVVRPHRQNDQSNDWTAPCEDEKYMFCASIQLPFCIVCFIRHLLIAEIIV